MIILNLKLNNIIAFKDFEINFSYPIKLRNTTIINENLEGIPTFRYKKLNVFIGANASGKTSLVKSIWKLILFLVRKDKNVLLEMVNTHSDKANIECDYVSKIDDEYYLTRVKINIFKDDLDNVLVAYYSIKLNQGSSYENKRKELDDHEYEFKDYISVLNELNVSTGWNIILPATESNFELINFVPTENEEEDKLYLDILNRVLKTLDPSITNVFKSSEANNAYVIEHLDTENIIVQEGNKLSSIPLLSSGTKYGFNIANIMFSIKKHRNGLYLIDEQFSYVNSDIEAPILSTMVDLLGEDEQIFFTTHNSSILDLGFPFHSFNFMKKENHDNRQYITSYCASEAENRNNVNAKSLLDNDVFGTVPDPSFIYEIGEKHDA